MKEPSIPEDLSKEEQNLLALGRYLVREGYHFTAVTPTTHEVNNRRNPAQIATGLRDIFGWSRPFARSAIPGEVFDLMQTAGILVVDGDLWRSSIRWSSLSGLLCAHSAYPTDAPDAVFFGPDTYRFARLVEGFLETNPGALNRIVDIGCGSGAGALLAARAVPAAQVLGVDINPKALRLSRVNAGLACTPNVEPVVSSLLDEVQGSFDLIISNPPYMLDAQARAYRHGGGELGAGLSVSIVETALDRLAPGGTLLLYTGVAIVDGHDPFLRTLERLLGQTAHRWSYQELDPDVFGDELVKPAYAEVERIAAVALTVRDRRTR